MAILADGGESHHERPVSQLQDIGWVRIVDVEEHAIEPSCVGAAEQLMGCDEVGVVVDGADWEQPIWELLKSSASGPPEIRHSAVVDAPGELAPQWKPSCLFVTRAAERDRAGSVIGGQSYRKTWTSSSVAVFQDPS